jgi:replicative DNA helicase
VTRNAGNPIANLEAEEHVLGSMMLSDRAIDAASERLVAADFYRESHGLIFAAILELRHEGTPAEPIAVAERLDRTGDLDRLGGKDRIRELATLAPAATNTAHHADIVAERALYRGLHNAGVAIAEAAQANTLEPAELLDLAEREVFDVAQRRDRRSEFAALSETVPAAWDEITERYDRGGQDVVGVATGLAAVDDLTSGLPSGSLIVVAGRPSMGKSAFALGVLAHTALRAGRPAAIFTLEMTKMEVTQRLISSEAQVDAKRLRTGRLEKGDWSRAAQAAGMLERAPLFVDDSRLTGSAEIRAKARRLKMRHPDLALVVVDYLQLMAHGGDRNDNRALEISRITRGLKVLAGELDVPVIALSQLSRQPENRHDNRPILADLRDSGAIEQDADIVVLLYRDEYYHPEDTDQLGVAEVNVAKQRNGPVGTVNVRFDKKYARFADQRPPEPVDIPFQAPAQEAFA